MRIYGPVPSRRFGLSLGVDVVTMKTCPFDCLYCQLGPTDCLTAEPEEFFPVEDVLADVEEALEDGPDPDVITMAGSGEPTLYAPLAELFEGLHELSEAPVLLITNSALFWRDEVARAALASDILAPSLDAGDGATYRRLNRPHGDVTFERLLDGLARVTHEHPGEVRLEVMLVRDVNDDPRSIDAIAAALERLCFDQLDVNTPVRPPVPERGALPCDSRVLDRALAAFGPKARAIGSFRRADGGRSRPLPRSFTDRDKDIREMLLRRPCTPADISASLGIPSARVAESLARLVDAGLVGFRSSDDDTYYHGIGPRPTIRQS